VFGSLTGASGGQLGQSTAGFGTGVAAVRRGNMMATMREKVCILDCLGVGACGYGERWKVLRKAGCIDVGRYCLCDRRIGIVGTLYTLFSHLAIVHAAYA
jgi:hypothetical protein